jgi:hypothetical protein
MPKLKSLPLYLSKPEIEDFDRLLTETARNMVDGGGAIVSDSADFADGARLYIFPGGINIQKWVPLLKEAFDFPDKLFN